MKLKINEHGLLFKTNTQIDTFMVDCIEELKNYSPQELRVSQQEIYEDFVKAKTGDDIRVTRSKDPFIDITGFPLRTFTLERFKKYPHSPIVMSATTDLAPLRYIRTTKQISKKSEGYERYSKEFKLKTKGTVESSFRFPGGPFFLKDSPWRFYYAANDHTISCKNKMEVNLIYGLVFLEEEPVQLLMNTPEFENLYHLLTIVINEFSHDLTGHGSIDFVIHNTPEAILYCGDGDKDTDVYTKTLSEFRKNCIKGSRMAIIFDEFRQLNIHMRLIEACIKKNGKYLMEIVENAHTFFELLKVATGKITGNSGSVVYRYFSQLYTFCLARMLPTHYMPLVISSGQSELFAEFLNSNEREGILNCGSTMGSGLAVPKQGFGKDIVSYQMDDIAYYLDHRTIFMSVYNTLMR